MRKKLKIYDIFGTPYRSRKHSKHPFDESQSPAKLKLREQYKAFEGVPLEKKFWYNRFPPFEEPPNY
jgi:hypothetical protein